MYYLTINLTMMCSFCWVTVIYMHKIKPEIILSEICELLFKAEHKLIFSDLHMLWFCILADNLIHRWRTCKTKSKLTNDTQNAVLHNQLELLKIGNLKDINPMIKNQLPNSIKYNLEATVKYLDTVYDFGCRFKTSAEWVTSEM